MMTTLRYTGQSHFREISKADFTRVDVDEPALKVARHDIFPEQNWKNHKTTVEVGDAAAEWLLANEPDEWEVVEDKDAASKDESSSEGEQSTSPNASDAPDGIGLDSPSGTPAASSRGSSTRSRPLT